MAEAQSSIAGSKCQFGDVDMDPRRVGKGKATNLNRLNSLLDMPCDPEEVTKKRILEIVEYLRRIQEKFPANAPRPEFNHDAAAPTAGFRAGGVQRKAAPNLFQTLIEAIAEVR